MIFIGLQINQKFGLSIFGLTGTHLYCFDRFISREEWHGFLTDWRLMRDDEVDVCCA